MSGGEVIHNYGYKRNGISLLPKPQFSDVSWLTRINLVIPEGNAFIYKVN